MHDPEAALLDIVTYGERIARYVGETSAEEFETDTAAQDQIIRCLAVIGEAARRIGDTTRSRIPALPWHAIIGMRNRLAHEYDGLDMRIVWLTATRDVPQIVAQVRAYLDGGKH